MLRRTLPFLKVSRNWTKFGSKTSAAHFPTAFVDPAAQRGAGSSAKETKVFRLDEDENEALPIGHKGAVLERNYGLKKMMSQVGTWAESVGFTDPCPTFMMVMPAFWGCGVAMTRLLVCEGADPIVLCAPILPIHLVVFICTGAILMRGIFTTAYDLFFRPKGMVCTALDSPVAKGDMSRLEAIGMLGAQTVLSSVLLLNIAPVAGQIAAAAVVPFAASAVVERFRLCGARTERASIWLRAIGSGMTAAVGYAAVSGRVDLAVVLPLFVASVLWSSFHATLRDLLWYREKDFEESSSSPSPSAVGSMSKSKSSASSSSTLSSSSPSSLLTAVAQKEPQRAVSSFRRAQPGSSSSSSSSSSTPTQDAVERLLPKLSGDVKWYWNVLTIPMACGLILTGVFSCQSLWYYIGVLSSVVYLHGVMDHVNIYDRWSCKVNHARTVRSGLVLLFFLCCSNLFWGMATEYDSASADKVDTASSGLHSLLSMQIVVNKREFSAADFTWSDRFFRPAWVKARVSSLSSSPSSDDGNAVATSSSTPPAETAAAAHVVNSQNIPAWMRREYFGQNVSLLMRRSGLFSDEYVDSWEQSWYAKVDHYNVFTKFVV